MFQKLRSTTRPTSATKVLEKKKTGNAPNSFTGNRTHDQLIPGIAPSGDQDNHQASERPEVADDALPESLHVIAVQLDELVTDVKNTKQPPIDKSDRSEVPE